MTSLDWDYGKRREEGDFSNLVRPELLQIFSKVKSMTVDTFSDCDHLLNKYSFSLLSMLSLIKESALEKVVIINWDKEKWLDWNDNAWNQEPREVIQQRYADSNYSIKMQQKEGRYGKEYHCVIQKK